MPRGRVYAEPPLPRGSPRAGRPGSAPGRCSPSGFAGQGGEGGSETCTPQLSPDPPSQHPRHLPHPSSAHQRPREARLQLPVQLPQLGSASLQVLFHIRTLKGGAISSAPRHSDAGGQGDPLLLWRHPGDTPAALGTGWPWPRGAAASHRFVHQLLQLRGQILEAHQGQSLIQLEKAETEPRDGADRGASPPCSPSPWGRTEPGPRPGSPPAAKQRERRPHNVHPDPPTRHQAAPSPRAAPSPPTCSRVWVKSGGCAARLAFSSRSPWLSESREMGLRVMFTSSKAAEISSVYCRGEGSREGRDSVSLRWGARHGTALPPPGTHLADVQKLVQGHPLVQAQRLPQGSVLLALPAGRTRG